MQILEEPPQLVDKGKTSAVLEEQSKTDGSPSLSKEAPLSPIAADKDADSILHSIQALFTSWEQVKVNSALFSSFATQHSTSFIFSTEDMNPLKKAVLACTSFMDKDISRMSAANQRELLACLSKDLADAIKRPILKLLVDIRLTLRGIHQVATLLLSQNVELKSNRMSLT
ncbi:Uncharacterized protein Adt_39726 [Abeliophyllum distichum]|uniref:Uncharacterized protein n=1 Tax=Abeliophyllum distichum TaxID=126358 RepID=A0ABD1Q5X0_9LAMI